IWFGFPSSMSNRLLCRNSTMPFRVQLTYLLVLAGLGSTGLAAVKPEPRFRNGKLVDLKVADRGAYIIIPQANPDPQRRWVWIAPFWLGSHLSGGAGAAKDEVSHQFYVDSLLGKGFHVAGVDVGTSCGSVPGVDVCHKFYELLTSRYKLNERTRM